MKIVWRDAWFSDWDDGDEQPMITTTVGHLIKACDDGYKIAMQLNRVGRYRHVMFIPNEMIIELQEIVKE